MRRAAKIDHNHAAIVRALRQAGCNVLSLAAVGNGCPDLFVTRAGTHYVLEVKSPTGKLTPAQVQFHAKHQPVHLVRNETEALASVGLCKPERG